MPRGDKDQIMRYELPTFTPMEEENIGNMMVDIMSKINVNRQINDNLRASRAQSQTQFELCRDAAVNADVSPNLQRLDHSSKEAKVRRAA